MYLFQISRSDRSADIQSEREAQLKASWLPSAARIYARLLRAPRLDSAIKDLHAQEMSRAATYGLRWRVLSDAGGFAVALLIAADCGLARAGVIADTTQMLGLASHCRVHAAVQTLTHLGGVTACGDPRDARTRLLAPDGWLPDFLNDWLRGQLGALSKCTSITANHHDARVALGEALRAAPATFLSLGPLDWLVHAVGGEAWLLSVLTETREHTSSGIVSTPSLKLLARQTNISRAHYATLRSKAEHRSLVQRSPDTSELRLTGPFYLQSRMYFARRLALIGAVVSPEHEALSAAELNRSP
ncbi:hypothetical protein OOZ54_08375 [Rhodopseudomonas palustris]|uniref:hypothetical protein n=1 Tax=Rhodopseudomonas palustris TaxID=1076 RepID=UPI0022F0F818|nr:hypothetical protein [Rhodopseudomonas palustris]WBU31498.1 hypothetical protein OOZ54_08375 [Rhodopseudomonas palustris]